MILYGCEMWIGVNFEPLEEKEIEQTEVSIMSHVGVLRDIQDGVWIE
jgi:hypothetical protein